MSKPKHEYEEHVFKCKCGYKKTISSDFIKTVTVKCPNCQIELKEGEEDNIIRSIN